MHATLKVDEVMWFNLVHGQDGNGLEVTWKVVVWWYPTFEKREATSWQ